MGLVAGAGLAVSGAAFQGLLRNPLAEPYVLGVSGGAALGASLMIAVGVGSTLFSGLLANTATTLAGLVATAAVYAIAARAGRASTARSGGDGGASILLAGVVVNAIASAMITLVKTLVRATTAQQILFWLAGFVEVPNANELMVVTAFVSIGAVILVRDAARLNLLALGDERAGQLGVDVRALERRVFLSGSLVVGAIVASCGAIGFVGLLVPQSLRAILGVDQRGIVPLSLVVGAATLVLCDALARASFQALGTEPPVGAITALLGGPMFLYVLATQPRGATANA